MKQTNRVQLNTWMQPSTAELIRTLAKFHGKSVAATLEAWATDAARRAVPDVATSNQRPTHMEVSP